MLYGVVDLESDAVDARVDSVCDDSNITDRIIESHISRAASEVVGAAYGDRLLEGAALGEAEDGENYGAGEDGVNKTAPNVWGVLG